MSKKLGTILVLIVAGALMLYSASRTMHMLSATLPAGQEILAVIALAAFDLGLIAWVIVFLRGAEGALQRGIALLMILVDLTGVIVGFLGDTLMTSGETGLLDKMAMGDKQTIVMLTAFVIAVNIAGAVFFHLADPTNLRRMVEESAKDKIASQSLKSIENEATILANELAPIIAADWVEQMRADFTAALGSRRAPQIAQPAPAPELPAPRSPIRAMFSRRQPAAQPQTMAASGTITLPDSALPRADNPATQARREEFEANRRARIAAQATQPDQPHATTSRLDRAKAEYDAAVRESNVPGGTKRLDAALAEYDEAIQEAFAPKAG